MRKPRFFSFRASRISQYRSYSKLATGNYSMHPPLLGANKSDPFRPGLFGDLRPPIPLKLFHALKTSNIINIRLIKLICGATSSLPSNSHSPLLFQLVQYLHLLRCILPRIGIRVKLFRKLPVKLLEDIFVLPSVVTV